MNSDQLICYCLGITRGQILDEARGKGPPEIEARIRGLIKSGECTCETSNPRGRCCLAEVRSILTPRQCSALSSAEQEIDTDCC